MECSRRILTVAVAILYPLGGDCSAESYRDEKLRELSGDLSRSRESLHRAHRELARKADRIAELEALLKENGIAIPAERKPDPEKGQSIADQKLSEAISKIKALEKRLVEQEGDGDSVPGAKVTSKRGGRSSQSVAKEKGEAVAKAGEKLEMVPGGKTIPEKAGVAEQRKMADSSVEAKPEERKESAGKPGKDKPRGAMILIHYDADSAVNLEGREKALEFVQRVLKRSPGAVFRVEGGADDSEFETSDRVIAENRAKFLVKYLQYREIPVEVFREVTGVSSREGEGPKKYVRITVISG